MTRIIDTHQHLWMIDEREYSWLDESLGPLFRNYAPTEIAPQLAEAGVLGTILVQSADTYEDTFYMLSVAAQFDFVLGVVGWVPLARPAEAEAALDVFISKKVFKGMRHLVHIYPDADWIVRPEIMDALRLIAERDLVFELVAVTPEHLEHAQTLARALPDLRIVIDHLAKPPIAEEGWEPWAGLLAAAASYDNVYAKVSGLNTAAKMDSWTAADLQPYVDHAIECFGPKRLMFGGDWPIATLAGDYQRVLDESVATLAGLSKSDRGEILWGTATRVYRLDVEGSSNA